MTEALPCHSVTPVPAWWIDVLQWLEIELCDGLEFFTESCDEQVFRELVEPLLVIGIQRQEGFQRCGFERRSRGRL